MLLSPNMINAVHPALTSAAHNLSLTSLEDLVDRSISYAEDGRTSELQRLLSDHGVPTRPEVLWQIGFGHSLRVALFDVCRLQPAIDRLREAAGESLLPERLRRLASYFYRPLSKKEIRRFHDDRNAMARDGAFRRSIFLRSSELEDADYPIRHGQDPILHVLNVGADASQITSLLFEEESEGDFPVWIGIKMGHREVYKTFLKRFALNRSDPYFSIELTLPATRLFRWAVENRHLFLSDSFAYAGQECLPAISIPSLIRESLRIGSAKIVALPGTRPGCLSVLKSSLQRGIFPGIRFQIADGDDFWDVTAATRSMRQAARYDQEDPKIYGALASWATTLYGPSWLEAENELIDALASLVKKRLPKTGRSTDNGLSEEIVKISRGVGIFWSWKTLLWVTEKVSLQMPSS
jgi:hypothetical protein